LRSLGVNLNDPVSPYTRILLSHLSPASDDRHLRFHTVSFCDRFIQYHRSTRVWSPATHDLGSPYGRQIVAAKEAYN
jgi:hypothetical protein